MYKLQIVSSATLPVFGNFISDFTFSNASQSPYVCGSTCGVTHVVEKTERLLRRDAISLCFVLSRIELKYC